MHPDPLAKLPPDRGIRRLSLPHQTCRPPVYGQAASDHFNTECQCGMPCPGLPGIYREAFDLPDASMGWLKPGSGDAQHGSCHVRLFWQSAAIACTKNLLSPQFRIFPHVGIMPWKNPDFNDHFPWNGVLSTLWRNLWRRSGFQIALGSHSLHQAWCYNHIFWQRLIFPSKRALRKLSSLTGRPGQGISPTEPEKSHSFRVQQWSYMYIRIYAYIHIYNRMHI